MQAIHFRIASYIGTVVLHVANFAAMHSMISEDQSEDLEIKVMKKMLYRFFTGWTIALQLLYAVLGFYCDILILKNSKNKKHKLANPIRSFRNILFSALVFPCCMVVFTLFWSLFLYDRSLIFPKFVDKVVSPTSNHILHTAIAPIALCEVVFRPRVEPVSHLRNLVQLTVYAVVYLCVFYYTYITEGIWLYPIFDVTYGSVHFFTLHVYLAVLFIVSYYMQWWLNNIIHGSRMVEKKMK